MPAKNALLKKGNPKAIAAAPIIHTIVIPGRIQTISVGMARMRFSVWESCKFRFLMKLSVRKAIAKMINEPTKIPQNFAAATALNLNAP